MGNLFTVKGLLYGAEYQLSVSSALIFFEDENGRTVTVTSDRYVHMLTDFVFPAL